MRHNLDGVALLGKPDCAVRVIALGWTENGDGLGDLRARGRERHRQAEAKSDDNSEY